MTLTIDDDILHAARLSEAELRIEMAVALFQRESLTLALAADLAGLDRLQFQHVLASRQIPMHYTAEDLDEDCRSIS
jgi:predicted HTH domain antitoxin